MTEIQEKAIERLNNDFKVDKIKGRCAQIIGSAVKTLIADFCGQEEEFAEFVLMSQSSIIDCITVIAGKIHGAGCSDIEVYTQAVKFYFPTATIHCSMTLDLAGDAKAYADQNNITVSTCGKQEQSKPAKKLSLSFDDLFGGI